MKYRIIEKMNGKFMVQQSDWHSLFRWVDSCVCHIRSLEDATDYMNYLINSKIDKEKQSKIKRIVKAS